MKKNVGFIPWAMGSLKEFYPGQSTGLDFTLRNHSKGEISKLISFPFLSPEFLTLLKAQMYKHRFVSYRVASHPRALTSDGRPSLFTLSILLKRSC